MECLIYLSADSCACHIFLAFSPLPSTMGWIQNNLLKVHSNNCLSQNKGHGACSLKEIISSDLMRATVKTESPGKRGKAPQKKKKKNIHPISVSNIASLYIHFWHLPVVLDLSCKNVFWKANWHLPNHPPPPRVLRRKHLAWQLGLGKEAEGPWVNKLTLEEEETLVIRERERAREHDSYTWMTLLFRVSVWFPF